MNIIQIKNNKTLVQMSCTAYIVYTFHLTVHHANFDMQGDRLGSEFHPSWIKTKYFSFNNPISIVYFLTVE